VEVGGGGGDSVFQQNYPHKSLPYEKEGWGAANKHTNAADSCSKELSKMLKFYECIFVMPLFEISQVIQK
jgi:hypothetical protein